MKKLLTRSGIALVTVAVVIAGAAAFSAYEAHIVNVTATIDNALSVPVSALDFGNVFPQEKFDKTFNMSLSQAFLSQGSGSNLLVNGDFEQPVVTNSAKWDIFPSGTSGLGWTVAWANPTNFGNKVPPTPALQELHRGVNGWLPQHGDQYAELDTDWDGPSGPLNGEPALVKISQTVATTPGQKYLVTFYFSPRPGTGAADNHLKLRWNNGDVSPDLSGDGSSLSQTAWTQYSYEVTGTGSDTLEFVGGGTNNSLGVFLDNVTLTAKSRVNTVTYQIRQKPKCAKKANSDLPGGPYAQVYDVPGVGGAPTTFACPDGYEIMPLLCPYLSKHELDANGQQTNNGISAFHGDPANWNLDVVKQTQVTGTLSAPGATTTAWNIDLKTPCFKGQCAQDWATFVQAANPTADPAKYMLDPSAEHKQLGCDLWVEVNGITSSSTPR